MNISERIGRLLLIVPWVAHQDGVLLSELAKKFQTSTKQIIKDIELLTLVGRPPLTPDHMIDLWVEDDRVYIHLDQNLSRPLKLTHEEARALALAVKLLGDSGGMNEDLSRLTDKILQHLQPHEKSLLSALASRIALADSPDESCCPSTSLRDAIETHRQVRLDYYSASSDRRKTYELQPLGLINHTGHAYLLALDMAADGQEKIFRLDRVGEVEVKEAVFVPPADLDLERFRKEHLYRGDDGVGALAYFDASVAGRVRERFEGQVEEMEDGGVNLRLVSSTPAWLARWVLPFGVHAEVLGPQDERAHLYETCRAAAELYK
ncbi:WYL domain-containing protein [Myxococcota bacterium]|nr:WYL domain-containing protein [Myxococcota bacterium]